MAGIELAERSRPCCPQRHAAGLVVPWGSAGSGTGPVTALGCKYEDFSPSVGAAGGDPPRSDVPSHPGTGTRAWSRRTAAAWSKV